MSKLTQKTNKISVCNNNVSFVELETRSSSSGEGVTLNLRQLFASTNFEPGDVYELRLIGKERIFKMIGVTNRDGSFLYISKQAWPKLLNRPKTGKKVSYEFRRLDYKGSQP